MTISPVFPLETTDCDAPFHWCQQNLFLKALSPSPAHRLDVGHPSWLPNPNLVFLRLLGESFAPWSNFQILDSPSLLGRRCDYVIELQPRRGLLEDSGKHFALSVKRAHGWGCLSYMWLGSLVWEAVCWGATAAPVTKGMAGRSAQSLKSRAARAAGTIQASCWVRPISPSEPNSYTRPKLWSLAGKKKRPSCFFLKKPLWNIAYINRSTETKCNKRLWTHHLAW